MAYNNDSFGNDNPQVILSYDLLNLLQWIIEHDEKKLKKIIARALKSGLQGQIQDPEAPIEAGSLEQQQHTTEEAHYNVIEFFGLLEELLQEAIHEQTVQTALEKNLMPAIDQIDSTICDEATVRFSVEKATSRLENNTKANPQEVLFQELLKRWKPSDKKGLN